MVLYKKDGLNVQFYKSNKKTWFILILNVFNRIIILGTLINEFLPHFKQV